MAFANWFRAGPRAMVVVAVLVTVTIASVVGMLARHRSVAVPHPVSGSMVVGAPRQIGANGHSSGTIARGRVGVATDAQQTDQAAGPAPAPVAGVRWTSGSMRVGHLRRGWWLATPDRVVHRRLPLLMILHGRGATPAAEAQRTGFLGVVRAGDAVAVYPAGYDESWNAGHCCGLAHEAGINDLAFLRQLAMTLQNRPDVEPADLDLVGFSNGAKMAFDLVCSGTLRPRAMAVAEAVPTTDCQHAPAVPLVQVAGTADPIVPYAKVNPALTAGGIPLVPVRTEISAWAARNGCSSSTLAKTVTQPDRSIQTWTRCRAPVALLTYPGGVHAWHPDATSYLWQFLNAGMSSAGATNGAQRTPAAVI